MDPIVLTEYGEELDLGICITNSREAGVEFSEDATIRISTVSYCATHRADKGFLYAHPVSEKYWVPRCASCGRIGLPIPNEVNTFRKLRQYCAHRLVSES